MSKAYKVEVKCTNSTKDTCCNYYTEGLNDYFKCKNGVLYVVTDNPKKIYNKFSSDTVLSITEIGVGYKI